MRVRVLLVLLLLLLLLLLLFVHAGAYCVASVDVQSLVQFLSRCRIVTRAQITFLPFSTGTHVIWAGYFCSCSTPGWSDRLD